MDFQPGDLEKAETFPCIETRLLLATEKALLGGNYSHALSLAEKRKLSFWSREQPALALRWSALEIAARLLGVTTRARDSLKRIKPSATEMVRAYTQFSEPWMMADRFHRHWETRLLNIDAEEYGGSIEFEKLAAKIRHDYVTLVDELNGIFVRSVQEVGFDLGGWIHQRHIFADLIAPVLDEGLKTAYLMVDALRYEMGAELMDGLNEDFEVSLQPGVGGLPSITGVGMACLLPGAEKGMELIVSAGKLAAVIEGKTLKDRQSRMAYLADRFGKDFVALKLVEVLKLSAKRKRELADCRLIVVTSQEIDRLGQEGDEQADTRRWMDEILEQLLRAIRILARQGVERFVISADHGHLFADQLDPGMLMDSPGGTTVELHPRVWIGRGGQAADGYVRVTASQLEVGGDLV